MALTVAFRIEVAAGVQQAPELRDVVPRVRRMTGTGGPAQTVFSLSST
ncbi:MAG: hypothetical protein OXC31_18195 [Spirochaetaceae bacterium]|nr:hypothetical protein [Spirochaetaceae bacterium]